MRGWIAWASDVRTRCRRGLEGQGDFYTGGTRETSEYVKWSSR